MPLPTFVGITIKDLEKSKNMVFSRPAKGMRNEKRKSIRRACAKVGPINVGNGYRLPRVNFSFCKGKSVWDLGNQLTE